MAATLQPQTQLYQLGLYNEVVSIEEEELREAPMKECSVTMRDLHNPQRKGLHSTLAPRTALSLVCCHLLLFGPYSCYAWSAGPLGITSPPRSSLILAASSKQYADAVESSSTNPASDLSKDDDNDKAFQRQRRQITLRKSRRDVTLISRTLPVMPDNWWNITVWEWERPSEVVESYWEAQNKIDMMSTTTAHDNNNNILDPPPHTERLLDPFGLVTWPGSLVAARELQKYAADRVLGKHALILGAGVGVEAQAAAECGAATVMALDRHPTTLQQLNLGVEENKNIVDKSLVKTKVFDLFDEASPLPHCDLVVVADVLYNEALARQVVRRLLEVQRKNPEVVILVTDSQRFVDMTEQWNAGLRQLFGEHQYSPVQWTEETLDAFTGSGVCIDDDQTYSVKVRKLWWIGGASYDTMES